MESLLALENWFTLLMLVMLQAVLGFDNLLYISIESSRVAPERQKLVRRVGIVLAILFRLVLMFIVLGLINSFAQPIFSIAWNGVLEGSFTFHALVSILGGGFIMWTATKEIMHLLAVDHIENLDAPKTTRSVGGAVALIVFMNLIFSFDSLLSAIALTHVVWVIGAGIIISGAMMIALADQVSAFLKAEPNVRSDRPFYPLYRRCSFDHRRWASRPYGAFQLQAGSDVQGEFLLCDFCYDHRFAGSDEISQ